MDFFDAYERCTLCPRDCKVDRTKGPLGFCRESAACRVSFIGAHFGEEPSFTGSRGSGTIFFSGCPSQCFFCQNYQISVQHNGRAITSAELLSEVCELIRKNVHNLNFVTPDHFWPHIQELCRNLREEGVKVPMLFNCSGYQKPEKVKEYARWMDIFLPDFKFAEPELAQACMGDERYPEIALQAIRERVGAKGFLEPWDTAGQQTARQGVLVRHLVLPGHIENSIKVLQLLHKEFGPGIPLSVMSQFQPVPECSKKQQLQRTLKAEEYDQVLALVEELGFEKVYTQEVQAKTAFLPDFGDPINPFQGNREKKP
jgi:putative pyruvate formate lyase activating enzyme